MDRKAVTALEFALVAPVVLVLIFGSLELGLIWWTKNALQMTAAITARCVALGSCADPGSFAVNYASNWALSRLISVSNVTYTTNGACYGSSKVYAMVTIDCEFWADSLLPPPIPNLSFSVSACYPMAS